MDAPREALATADALDLKTIDTTFADAIEAAGDLALAHHVAVETTYAMPIAIHADPSRVEQIVRTLVDNARVHGMPPVQISTAVAGSLAAIVVHDHGPGIPQAREEEIFAQFTPLSNRPESNGLGLYTARRLARAMGGDVWYGHGRTSSFVLLVPRARTT